MRVGIIALLQESNTFFAGRTTLAHFEQDLLVEGEEVRRRLADAHHETGGFFEGLAKEMLTAPLSVHVGGVIKRYPRVERRTQQAELIASTRVLEHAADSRAANADI